MGLSGVAIGSVVERINGATRHVGVTGEFRAAHFSEPPEHPDIFLLFFLPAGYPDIVLAVKFDTDVVEWGVDRLRAHITRAITAMMRQL